MRRVLIKSWGVLGVGLSWSLAGAAVFAALGLMAATLRPQDVDPGEGPAVIVRTGLLVGFLSGTVYGLMLAFTARGRTPADLSLLVVGLWGSLAAAVPALVTSAHPSMLYLLCPFGALWAATALLAARRSELPKPQAPLLKLIGRCLAATLRAACRRATG